MNIEYEVRYYPINLDKHQITEILSDENIEHGRTDYNRVVFDIDKQQNLWGRVRYSSSKAKTSLTIKQSDDCSTVDGTQEFEIHLNGNKLEEFSKFFYHMGFTDQIKQENYRYYWHLYHYDTISFITLDIWPGLKPVLEIESTCEENIIEIEKKLGLNKEDRFPGDIPDIYAKEFNITREEFKNIKDLTFEKYGNH